MSEENSAPAEVAEPKSATQEGVEAPAEPGNGFEPITSQAQLNKVLNARLARERAKYSDYAELKERVAGWDKLVERAETAEARLSAVEHENQVRAWRASAASEYGVPADALRGDTEEELTAHAKQLSELIQTPAAEPARVVVTGAAEPQNMALNSDGIAEAFRKALGL